MNDLPPVVVLAARAVVAACRETGADPEECVQGRMFKRRDAVGRFALSRARVYAAFALDEVLDRSDNWIGLTSISRMVGASSYRSHLSSARHQQRHGLLSWFDDAALERVKRAVRTGQFVVSIASVEALPPHAPKIPTRMPPAAVRATVSTAVSRSVRAAVSEFSAPLVMKRKPVPAHLCEDLTPGLAGDPPRERSALARRSAVAAVRGEDAGVIAHPSFDPAAGVWFLGTGQEAPTLRELLAKLPRGSRIADYYPDGYVAEPWPSVSEAHRAAETKLRPKFRTRPASRQYRVAQEAPTGRRANNRGGQQKYDHDAVLNAWARGEGTGGIARALCMPCTAVCAIVQLARQKGDARAMYVGDPRRWAA